MAIHDTTLPTLTALPDICTRAMPRLVQVRRPFMDDPMITLMATERAVSMSTGLRIEESQTIQGSEKGNEGMKEAMVGTGMTMDNIAEVAITIPPVEEEEDQDQD